MIARVWKCLCPQETAEGFLGHLRATGVAEAKALPGYRGHQIQNRRADDETVEFILVTWWDTMTHARVFAGAVTDEAAARAVLYPGDERYRIVPDRYVLHYEVLEGVLK